MEISPWDDGYESPTSPTYRCEDVQQGSHDEACLTSDVSRILGRDPSSENEDPFLRTEKEDYAYNALVDDFMDAVMTSWRNPNPIVTVDEEAHQKQANRFVELALKRYNKNKNNKVKYALVEAIVSSTIFEGSELYGHVNFYLKAKMAQRRTKGEYLNLQSCIILAADPTLWFLSAFSMLYLDLDFYFFS
nr:unnamed protein product [Digitaria exilis]